MHLVPMLDGVAREDGLFGARTREETLAGDGVVIDTIAKGRRVERELRAELPTLLDRGAQGVVWCHTSRGVASARRAQATSLANCFAIGDVRDLADQRRLV